MIVPLNLHETKDSDIIEYLQNSTNRSAIMRIAIREYIWQENIKKNGGITQPIPAQLKPKEENNVNDLDVDSFINNLDKL